MAWIEPITDRASTQTRTTTTDMNRICGNINLASNLPYGTSLPTVWGRPHEYDRWNLVQDRDWADIIAAVTSMATELGLEAPTDSTHYENLNYIEEITRRYVDGGLFPQNTLYPSETLYPRARRA